MHMLEVPLIIFLTIVAPVWIVFHYIFRDKKQARHGESSSEDKKKIEELLAMADQMEERLKTLESILDRENPNWRAEA